MLLKKMCPYAVVSARFPNALPMQLLDNLCVTHQSQVTLQGFSYEAVLLSSEKVPGETFYCSKIFAVVRQKDTAEGIFEKEPSPPPPEIHNSTAPLSAPGDPIEAGVFDASNQVEEISLVSNQGMKFDDDMEPTPKNVPLVDTPDTDTLFDRYMWGWDGINCRAVAAYNQNEPPFKNVWIPQNLSYINIFLHCLPLKWLIIVLLPPTSRSVKEADISPFTYGDLLRYLGLWLLISACYG